MSTKAREKDVRKERKKIRGGGAGSTNGRSWFSELFHQRTGNTDPLFFFLCECLLFCSSSSRCLLHVTVSGVQLSTGQAKGDIKRCSSNSWIPIVFPMLSRRLFSWVMITWRGAIEEEIGGFGISQVWHTRLGTQVRIPTVISETRVEIASTVCSQPLFFFFFFFLVAKQIRIISTLIIFHEATMNSTPMTPPINPLPMNPPPVNLPPINQPPPNSIPSPFFIHFCDMNTTYGIPGIALRPGFDVSIRKRRIESLRREIQEETIQVRARYEKWLLGLVIWALQAYEEERGLLIKVFEKIEGPTRVKEAMPEDGFQENIKPAMFEDIIHALSSKMMMPPGGDNNMSLTPRPSPTSSITSVSYADGFNPVPVPPPSLLSCSPLPPPPPSEPPPVSSTTPPPPPPPPSFPLQEVGESAIGRCSPRTMASMLSANPWNPSSMGPYTSPKGVNMSPTNPTVSPTGSSMPPNGPNMVCFLSLLLSHRHN